MKITEKTTSIVFCGVEVTDLAKNDLFGAQQAAEQAGAEFLSDEEITANATYFWLTSCSTPNGATHYNGHIQARGGDFNKGYVTLNNGVVCTTHYVRGNFGDGRGTVVLLLPRHDLRPEDMGKPDPRYAHITW